MGRRPKPAPREQIAAAFCIGAVIGAVGPLLAVLFHQRRVNK